MRRRRYLSKSIGGRRETGSPVIAASRWFGECLKRPSIGARPASAGAARHVTPSASSPSDQTGGWRELFTQPSARADFSGSTVSQSSQRKIPEPLPSAGWTRIFLRPHLGQIEPSFAKGCPCFGTGVRSTGKTTIINLQLNVLAAHRQRTVAPNAVLHVKRGRESRVKPENPTPAIGLKCSRSPRTRRKSVRDGKNGRPVRRQQPPKR